MVYNITGFENINKYAYYMQIFFPNILEKNERTDTSL